jgi:hypothetical protein
MPPWMRSGGPFRAQKISRPGAPSRRTLYRDASQSAATRRGARVAAHVLSCAATRGTRGKEAVAVGLFCAPSKEAVAVQPSLETTHGVG